MLIENDICTATLYAIELNVFMLLAFSQYMNRR